MGGSGEIKIDVEAFQKARVTLLGALRVFSDYSSEAIWKMIVQLEPYNSAFISEMINNLNIMKKTKATVLVDNLMEFALDLGRIAGDFVELDDLLADTY